MTVPSTERTLVRFGAVLIVALMLLAAGLQSFGIWQPAELRVADLARNNPAAEATPGTPGATGPRASAGRVEQGPPLRVGIVRWGFSRLGPNEFGGRLPTALLAVLATLALAAAVASATDSRTGAFVGIAYASMPLVFMNARQMFGGGVSQSGATLLFASLLALFWGRPTEGPRRLGLGLAGALLGAVLAVQGGGVMLALAPVLLGIGLAVALRYRDEEPRARVVGLVLLGVGVVLAVQGVVAAIGGESAGLLRARGILGVEALCPRAAGVDAYCMLTGATSDARPPSTLPTYEALLEHIGHGLFPWTGFVAFGMARLLAGPPRAGGELGKDGEPVGDEDALREQGIKLAALCVAAVCFGLQSFHLQQFGLSPFVAVAPLAMAGGMLLRDAEREAVQWRIVTAGATFFTLIMARDFGLFPKSSYAALGLTDGGPAFPTGFTGKIGDWWRAQAGHHLGSIFTGSAPGEVYFLVELLLFIGLALAPLYQGAGNVKPFAWNRPFTWAAELELEAQQELRLVSAEAPVGWSFLATAREWSAARFGQVRNLDGKRVPRFAFLSSTGFMAFFRFHLLLGSVLLKLVLLSTALNNRVLTTPVRLGLIGASFVPEAALVGCWAVILLWNIHAWLGNPGRPVERALGSRVGVVLAGTVLTSMVIAHLFVPALSEHMSPRGVWAVIRQLRLPTEPVARFGGNQGDQTARYYANTEVRDLFSENDAVEWLRNRDSRHFLIVGSDVFPSLNRAYRQAYPQPQRQNIPVIDANNSNLYVAASLATGSGSRNPFDSVVMTNDRLTNGRPPLEALPPGAANPDHWHPHGRWEGSRFIPEAARFNDNIEYLGYNLDSNGQSYVPVGGSFRIKYHFRVVREIGGAYQVFVHTDGQCPRINGDHEPAGGRYPVRYWLPGDIIHDEQTITIPPYCRAGTYYVYIGFFQGDDRMRVTGGDHDRENRVIAARVVVR